MLARWITVMLLVPACAAAQGLTREDARDHAARMASDAQRAFWACTGIEARKLAVASREPAGSIADAAFSRCARFEADYRARLADALGSDERGKTAAREMIAQLRTMSRERAIRIAIETRAE